MFRISFKIYLGSVQGLLRVVLAFLWLVWGLFIVDVGFIHMGMSQNEGAFPGCLSRAMICGYDSGIFRV